MIFHTRVGIWRWSFPWSLSRLHRTWTWGNWGQPSSSPSDTDTPVWTRNPWTREEISNLVGKQIIKYSVYVQIRLGGWYGTVYVSIVVLVDPGHHADVRNKIYFSDKNLSYLNANVPCVPMTRNKENICNILRGFLSTGLSDQGVDIYIYRVIRDQWRGRERGRERNREGNIKPPWWSL